MNTQKKSILMVAGLLALLALSSIACSFSGGGARTFSPVVDVVLTEDMLDWASGKADFQNGGLPGGWYVPFHNDGPYEELLDEYTRIELHDGFLRFLGSKDGQAGSFDLSMGAEDGALKAQVVAVDIPGLELDDSLVAQVNREIEQALTEMVRDTQGEVEFKKVEVREGTLRMKVKVYID